MKPFRQLAPCSKLAWRSCPCPYRQARLRGVQQRHLDGQPRSRTVQTLCPPMTAASVGLSPAGAGRGVHRRRRADRGHRRQPAARSAGRHAGRARCKLDGPFVYSLEVKRDWERRVRYECPAQLSPPTRRRCAGCAGTAGGHLAAATWAGSTSAFAAACPTSWKPTRCPDSRPTYSDLVLMARPLGIEYRTLIGRILDAALERIGRQEFSGVRVSSSLTQ